MQIVIFQFIFPHVIVPLQNTNNAIHDQNMVGSKIKLTLCNCNYIWSYGAILIFTFYGSRNYDTITYNYVFYYTDNYMRAKQVCTIQVVILYLPYFYCTLMMAMCLVNSWTTLNV